MHMRLQSGYVDMPPNYPSAQKRGKRSSHKNFRIWKAACNSNDGSHCRWEQTSFLIFKQKISPKSSTTEKLFPNDVLFWSQVKEWMTTRVHFSLVFNERLAQKCMGLPSRCPPQSAVGALFGLILWPFKFLTWTENLLSFWAGWVLFTECYVSI